MFAKKHVLRLSFIAAIPLLAGGCPAPPAGGPVSAVIGISSTNGSAPLTITVTAVDSSSTNAGALTYLWDFGDGSATATQQEVTHVYSDPGMFLVTLKVTDSAGETDQTEVAVRARGQDPTAVIGVDRSAGSAPLNVVFDGTSSNAPDDVIRDYAWDFGDGTSSHLPTVSHNFLNDGEYEVRLRVTTAGGATGSTSTTISVGAATGSLQFNGSQFATLPIGDTPVVTDLTVESWFRSDSDGGTLLVIGNGGIAIALTPATNTLQVVVNGVQYNSTVASLAGDWRQVALVYSTSAGITLYLDGAPLGSFAPGGQVTLGQIILGNGFRGKAAEVRLWSVARSGTDIAANRLRRIESAQEGLVGAWPLDEGNGQRLDNAAGDIDGVLGSSTAIESSDPAWSTDAPPF